jgi:protein-disulfide isomerase
MGVCIGVDRGWTRAASVEIAISARLAFQAHRSLSSRAFEPVAGVRPGPAIGPAFGHQGVASMHRMVSALVIALMTLAAGASAAPDAADPRMAEHGIGNPKAPVRMDEYYSLDCPHCAEFDLETLPKLKADYIDAGKVYLVLHDFPLHEAAVSATELARCAPPDRFVAMVETLFRVQRGWAAQSTVEAQVQALKQQAKFAGLTDDQINACLNDQGLEDAILNERLVAERDLGINATPTFIFDQNPKADDRIVAAGPYDAFKAKIDSLLKK